MCTTCVVSGSDSIVIDDSLSSKDPLSLDCDGLSILGIPFNRADIRLV